MNDPAVVGRSDELAEIEHFLARPWPAMLYLEGEAGIGKSTLWQATVDRALLDGRVAQVLRFRPGEAEHHLAFAGLGGLFSQRVLDELLPQLPRPRRRALESALLLSDADQITTAPVTVGLGVLSMLLLLARKPVLLAIDDLPWLDESSVAALAFALRRLDSAPVGLVAAGRSGSAANLARLSLALTNDRATKVNIGPLSPGAVGQLIQLRLGLTIPRHALIRLHEASRG